ncbi:MAG: ABC transporter permease [Lachnospiraceae bacterium]
MREKFARWHILYLRYLKRDWKMILIWVLLLGFFSGGLVPAFEEMAKGQGLVGMFETMKNPAMISMVGPTPAKTASDYTLGAMYAQEMLLFCGLFAMIIAALHVVSHTRKEEEQGLLELIRSFQVGRQANSMAVMLESLTINLLLALVSSGIMISFQADTITTEGSMLFGLSVGMAGLMGGILALVFAQLSQSASGATGFSMAVIGILYILRGVTDVSAPSLSIFNPMGWTYLTYPLTENNWYPLCFGLVFILILAVLSFALEDQRDMGAGYLPVREGRAHAGKTLLSLPGLFLRLNRGVIIAWQITFFILGAAYGSIYGDMQSFLESNEMIQQMFSYTGISIEASFTSTIMMVMIAIACILPILIMNKLFAQENGQYLSQLYSTKITRSGLFITTILIAVINGALGIFVSVLGLGGTAIAVLSGKGDMVFGDYVAAGFGYFPAMLFLIGLTAIVLGFCPRFGKIIYIYLGYNFAVNYFGNLIDLPEVVKKSALLSWFPRLPAEEFDSTVFAVITILGILLIVVGYLGYIRRDRMEGA